MVARTAGFNSGTSLVAALSGILLARWLGPVGRGDYAGITSYYSLICIFFELGLAYAISYTVAKRPEEAWPYARVTTKWLLATGLVAALLTAAFSMSPMVAARNRTSFLVVCVCIVVSLLATPPTGALQPLALQYWNLIRFTQPLIYLALISILQVMHGLSVLLAITCLALSLASQTVIAWVLFLIRVPKRTEKIEIHRRKYLAYGVANMMSTAPNSINGRFDQVLLSSLVAASSLGQYAVAVSLTVVMSPLVMAFGNVAFPELARGGPSRRTILVAVKGSMMLSLAGMLVIVLVAPALTTYVFGPGYERVPFLVYILAPGTVCYVTNRVLGDCLRGLGRPEVVARCEWIGVAGMLVGLFGLVPMLGVLGAAITSSVVYAGTYALLFRAIRRAST